MRAAPRRGRPRPAVLARPHLRGAPARVTPPAARRRAAGARWPGSWPRRRGSRCACAGSTARAAAPGAARAFRRVLLALVLLVAAARVARPPGARRSARWWPRASPPRAAAGGRPRARLPPAPGLAGRAPGTSPRTARCPGIVALRVRDGLEHLVFVPHVPYSGSLKSHLAAPLAARRSTCRAPSRWSSVLFYCAVRGRGVPASRERAWRRSDLALAAGLYLAFAPAFVTRYSLSNDGNYVEVLALGTWRRCWRSVRLGARTAPRRALPLVAGAAARPRLLVPHPGRDPRRGRRRCSCSARAARRCRRWRRLAALGFALGDVPGAPVERRQRLGVVPLPAARGRRRWTARAGRRLSRRPWALLADHAARAGSATTPATAASADRAPARRRHRRAGRRRAGPPSRPPERGPRRRSGAARPCSAARRS